MATTLAGMVDGILHSIAQIHTTTITVTTTIIPVLSITTLQADHTAVQAAITSVDTLHTVVAGRAMVAVFLAWPQPARTAATEHRTELA